MDDMKIYEAASCNNLEYVCKALAGVYGKQQTDDLELALTRAACNGHLECVNILLENNVNVNAANGNEDTSLILAAQNGHKDVIKTLIGHKCNVNHQNSRGDSALMKACLQGHIEIVKILLEHGAKDRKDDVVEDHTGIANGVSKLPKFMPHGHTSMMVTVMEQPESYKRILKLLLDSGFQVNEIDLQDMTVLHHAANKCPEDVIEMLVEAGADVNAKDVWGVTALMTAVAYGKTNNVRMLLKHGASVSITCKAKRTALSIASRIGSEELISTLLSSGADPNTKDAHGHVPLFIAIMHNNYAAIKCLVQAGCDLNIICRDLTTFHKMSCFRCALHRKNVGSIEMLHQAGAHSNKEVYEALNDEALKQHCGDVPEIFELLNKYAFMPPSLRSMCRVVVKNSCRYSLRWPDTVVQLHLPRTLQDYLCYSDLSIPWVKSLDQ